MSNAASIEFTPLPDLPETPAELTARARSLIVPARICAQDGGHRLGRWKRLERGWYRDQRYYYTQCRDCGQTAYVNAGRGLNEYGGGAVLYRCRARPENRCQETLSGTNIITDANGDTLEVGRGCPRPYLTIWVSSTSAWPAGPGLKLCLEHSRQYRQIAAGPNPHHWRQRSGPTDY